VEEALIGVVVGFVVDIVANEAAEQYRAVVACRKVAFVVGFDGD
jgi:hypothetical protein